MGVLRPMARFLIMGVLWRTTRCVDVDVFGILARLQVMGVSVLVTRCPDIGVSGILARFKGVVPCLALARYIAMGFLVFVAI